MKENRRKITNRSITNFFYSKELYTIIRSAHTQQKKKREKKRNMEIRFTGNYSTPCCVCMPCIRDLYAALYGKLYIYERNTKRKKKFSELSTENLPRRTYTTHRTAQHSHRHTGTGKQCADTHARRCSYRRTWAQHSTERSTHSWWNTQSEHLYVLYAD